MRELAKARVTKHGMYRSPEYQSWLAMKARCSNPNNSGFEYYGGRGISVCEEWSKNFLAFFADVGPRPGPGFSLDRIDVNGSYAPGNVRWADGKQQIQNRRRRQARAVTERRRPERLLPLIEIPF
jgi:hypothetical protein